MVKQSSTTAKILLLITAAIWGSTFFIIRDSVQIIAPSVLLCLRFLITAGVLGLVGICQRKAIFKNCWQGLILGVLMTSTLLAQFWGLQFTSATNSGFITGLMIVFVPIYSLVFWRRKISVKNFIPVIISLLGLYLLVGGVSNINIGDVITLVTAASYGLYIIFAQDFMQKNDAIVLNFQQSVVVAILGFFVAVYSQASFHLPWLTVGPSILYLSLVATCLAFSLQLIGQKHVLSLQASLILATEPLFAAFFAWSLGSETISLHQIIGGALIFIALIINELVTARQKRTKEGGLVCKE